MELVDKIKKLTELKQEREERKAKLQEIENLIRSLEEEINAAMLEQGISNLKIDGVGTAYVASRLYASVRKADVDRTVEWLKQIGIGDISTRTINSSTLSAIIKDLLDEGKSIPDFVNYYVKNTVNIRR